ncbi:MAG: hypothetical protein HY348_13400 [Nitrospira defluvii]|nr:hypothetical protein [Nitrospira defluvii]
MRLALPEGQRRKEAGLNAVETSHEGFLETLRQVAIRISLRDGFVSSDEVRAEADQMGVEPVHQNAWGSLFRGHDWMEVGRKRSTIPGNHHREIRIWRYIA